jgi:hypothetical protein
MTENQQTCCEGAFGDILSVGAKVVFVEGQAMKIGTRKIPDFVFCRPNPSHPLEITSIKPERRVSLKDEYGTNVFGYYEKERRVLYEYDASMFVTVEKWRNLCLSYNDEELHEGDIVKPAWENNFCFGGEIVYIHPYSDKHGARLIDVKDEAGEIHEMCTPKRCIIKQRCEQHKC